MALGSLFFAAPWALAAFAALPLLIWLLRATPPPPMRQAFPPLRLLLDLRTEETQRHRAPWWLVALRALAASLLILGFARPSWRPPLPPGETAGPLLLVLDDGWTSAPEWSAARNAALAAIEETARQGGGPVTLLTTAPTGADPAPLEALAAADAKARVLRLQPQPWRPDRGAAAARLEGGSDFRRVVWVSDGLAAPGDEALRAALARFGPLAVRTPARTARALTAAEVTAEGVRLVVRRETGGPAAGAAAIETEDGRSLGALDFRFAPGQQALSVLIPLPPEISARAAEARLVNEASAGAVRLLSGAAGRPLVGLSAPADDAPPLLADLFYLERAIQPFATPRRGEVTALLDADAQALLLADQGRLSVEELRRLEAWLEAGGVLVRFAGPRLANEPDGLLPAPLRPGARAFGGALAWEQPQPFAPFEETSPFFGLTPPPDVRVSRQVLAQPYALAGARVWARLADGAPVVTATPKGKGLLVLFHVTAGPAWSNLPLSGLYVEMLRRVLAFAGRAEVAQRDVRPGPWTPERLFNGFGALQPARSQLLAQDAALDAGEAGPALPPGVYAREGSPARVLHAAGPQEPLAPLVIPAGAERLGVKAQRSAPIAGWLLGAAAALAAADILLALALARGMRLGAGALKGAAAVLVLGGLGLAAAPAESAYAQIELRRPPGFGLPPPPPPLENPQDVQLAFVRTGDAGADAAAEQGLEALSQVLFERTAVEPGPVVGVDPATDDLSAFPFLYWAAPANPSPPPPRAAAALDRFMRLGGLLLLDTRGLGGNPARTLLAGLDAPPLETADPRSSIYGKSFYLLTSFPGRRGGVQLWAETAAAAAARDGVASLVLGDGDWASAWAGLDGADPRQREMTLRFGVNMVMVALTGNYKADQVHLRELLKRLGREP